MAPVTEQLGDFGLGAFLRGTIKKEANGKMPSTSVELIIKAGRIRYREWLQ